MRVITGTARGKRLSALSGDDIVRPTSDRVKEGIFSAIQFDIEGRRFIDLFAGSGQMGIEALSRDAASAVFLDSSDEAIAVIKENLKNTGFTDKAKVLKGDFASYCMTSRETFDIAFIDPPYSAGYFEKAIEAVAHLMSDFGMIICEHPLNTELPQEISGFCITRSYRYGKIAVDLYRKAGN